MRIYVDLDGVLADFDHRARHLFGMEPGEFQELHGAKVLWQRIAAAADFYRMLPWTWDGAELWSRVCEMAPSQPIILTGLPLGDWAEPQKREWCRRELGPGAPVICCMSIDKWQHCTPGDVLIDDRKSAALPWIHAGGVFILHESADSTIAALEKVLNPGPDGRGAADLDPQPTPQGSENGR